ncbi:MAG: 30S ribosomal protein S17 [bacterium]
MKELVGVVVSDKMDKTITVVVERVKMHRIYKKRFVVQKKYYANDVDNKAKIGDMVKIRESKPMSKLKRWELVEVVK